MNDLPLYKTVCQLDGNHFFLGIAEADLDQYAGDGSYLIPAGCVDTAPPQIPENHIAQWQPDTQQWAYLPDFRGQIAYHTATGETVEITEWGELPDYLTLTVRPTEYHVWDSKKKTWKIDTALQKQIQAEQLQTAKNEKLKQLVNQAQQFVIDHTQTDMVPLFEQETYVLQGTEAKAWAQDPATPTPILDRIAAARGIPADTLKQAALRKTLAYEVLTALAAGQRQALQDQIISAQTLDDLNAVEITFRLPENAGANA